jgi:hypothetical protein
MTLVINQLLYQQSLDDEQPSDIVNYDTTEDPPPDVTIFLWDWCIDSDDEKIEEFFVENTPAVKVVPRYYNLHSKGPVPNIFSSQDTSVPLGKIAPPITTPKPSISTQTKGKNKFDMVILGNIDKPSTSNPTMNSVKYNTYVPNNKTSGTQSNPTISRLKR